MASIMPEEHYGCYSCGHTRIDKDGEYEPYDHNKCPRCKERTLISFQLSLDLVYDNKKKTLEDEWNELEKS